MIWVSSAARAAAKGIPGRTEKNIRHQIAQIGMPGTPMRTMTQARRTSQATITRRLGSRSASPESKGPPINGGRKFSASVTPVAKADSVTL